MADNGTTILLLDGTTAGYTIDVQSKAFSRDQRRGVSTAAIGSTTSAPWFAINRPGTREVLTSRARMPSPGMRWILASKTSSADPLVAAVAFKRSTMAAGHEKRGGSWYFSGNVNFPFQQLPNVVIEHGVAATYSIGQSDKFLFWAHGRQGRQAMDRARGCGLFRS